MKRKNVECLKPRRALKRPKIGEGVYGSAFVYVKFLIVWLVVIAADFLFDFRFEYLWPFWLLLRSVYDSFRYQGLAFSILFVCMAVTSDMICLLFIPVNWLFFAASTYVWVQFIWHTEKGVCMPSIILWALFIYIEAVVRIKDIKNAPFHLDLCRPFAAHCIGYPVVTLGFGLKSYVGYRLRQRKQCDISKENEFYFEVLQQALPLELQRSNSEKTKEEYEDVVLNGDIEIKPSVGYSGALASFTNYNGSISNTSNISNHINNHSSTVKNRGSRGGGGNLLSKEINFKEDTSSQSLPQASKVEKNKICNGSITVDLDFVQKKGWSSSKSINDFEESESDKDKSNKSISSSKADLEKRRSSSANTSQLNGSAKISVSHPNDLKDTTNQSAKDKKSKNKENNKESAQRLDSVTIIRLEADVKRLKSDLNTSRQTEQDLRNQINKLVSEEKVSREELEQLRSDNENLQNKLHNLVTSRQSDRSHISSLERKYQDERRCRQVAEGQVAQVERRVKKVEEQSQQRVLALQNSKVECSDSCRLRRSELEGEVKRLRREHRSSEERVRLLERESISLRQYKESQGESEVLMSALSAMQDKMNHLETSLSSETKIKLDLLSALGECKRHLEIAQGQINVKEKEIEELKTRIAEVLAVSPTSSSFPTTSSPHEVSRYQYSSRLLPPEVSITHDASPIMSDSLLDSGLDHLVSLQFSSSLSRNMDPHMQQLSNLDPNAMVYTPKE